MHMGSERKNFMAKHMVFHKLCYFMKSRKCCYTEMKYHNQKKYSKIKYKILRVFLYLLLLELKFGY